MEGIDRGRLTIRLIDPFAEGFADSTAAQLRIQLSKGDLLEELGVFAMIT